VRGYCAEQRCADVYLERGQRYDERLGFKFRVDRAERHRHIQDRLRCERGWYKRQRYERGLGDGQQPAVN
jgi:hypothetical protein